MAELLVNSEFDSYVVRFFVGNGLFFGSALFALILVFGITFGFFLWPVVIIGYSVWVLGTQRTLPPRYAITQGGFVLDWGPTHLLHRRTLEPWEAVEKVGVLDPNDPEYYEVVFHGGARVRVSPRVMRALRSRLPAPVPWNPPSQRWIY
ncbi:MAG: hypothetical protein KGJ23_11320 [Euryarchaeota archaeon]|nr:hypothetical protein [Euryarchaeota archaeon]MDE1837184.1 hypothetical protein [Euryarchaeota archaeon]MDE1881690.1 hypothetical protein [Euryarchaeota archaeon]MDE2045340.1 hypothetical protein [Thermoplasmata archaeon]